jgi:hypothetical protein
MQATKREKPGGWFTDEKRGQWYAVDRRTGRRIRVHDRERAAEVCAENNERELCNAATIPQAFIWGK